jgi:hypothetical protein
MPEAALELRAILDSAEQAASVQDFASAERYLRQAAALQEAQLGAEHPDLANTLNNLGIVCERRGHPDDAEACYRRAYAIASSRLRPDDPLVLTSRQNLRDFCAATGRPFEPVPPPPALSPPSPARPTPPPTAPAAAAPPAPVAAPPGTPVTPSKAAPMAASKAAPASGSPAVPFPARPATTPSPSKRVERGEPRRANSVHVTPVAVPVESRASTPRRPGIWVVVASAILAVLVIVLAAQLSRSSNSSGPAVTPEPPRAETPAPSEPPASPVASTVPEAPAATPAPARSTNTDAVGKPAVATTISLAESRLCRSLTNWRCTPASNPAEPGVFIFYTRVKSARDTTVQHRWYLNGDLRRSVELDIGANPGEGYRTYSRNTVAAERRGNWTIELRDAAGALLHEERFLVQ